MAKLNIIIGTHGHFGEELVKSAELITGKMEGVVMGMYLYITKRGPKYLRLICYTMVIAIALTFFGII